MRFFVMQVALLLQVAGSYLLIFHISGNILASLEDLKT